MLNEQVIIQESESDLQRLAYLLGKLVSEYDMEISTVKTKMMAFRRKRPIRSKTIINGEQLYKYPTSTI